MRVELLHYEGCPLAPAAHRLVRQCLVAVGVPDPVLVRVGDYPSPTVLVNGTDVMGGSGLALDVCHRPGSGRRRARYYPGVAAQCGGYLEAYVAAGVEQPACALRDGRAEPDGQIT